MRTRTDPANPIRSARERSGLTREQLAVKAGLSLSTVYLAERAGLVSEATAAKLARALGVSAKELLAARPEAPKAA
jgi:transcriptional regulator with XRE-family HTH domain